MTLWFPVNGQGDIHWLWPLNDASSRPILPEGWQWKEFQLVPTK